MNLYDFSSWNVFNGFSEGSGRSEKVWLQRDTEIGLFKFPKSELTTEHISEKIASSLANLLGMPCANIDIGYYNGRIGVMSYSILDNRYQSLREGVWFISNLYDDFNPETLFCEKENIYYSVDMLLLLASFFDRYNATKENSCTSNLLQVLKMLIFDALIGNSDRHQSNWAYIVDERTRLFSFSSLYDNGSSLCSYILDENIRDILGDPLRFNALIDTKSRSIIRVNPKNKKTPTHREMLKFIKANYYKDIAPFVDNILALITDDNLIPILNEFPNAILSPSKKKLIHKFLMGKKSIIQDIFIDGV